MEFKKGKKVRVVANSNGHKYPIGSVVVMSEEYPIYFIAEVGGYGDYWAVRYSDCEEIELTLEEVREHFKDAKEVRCLCDGRVWTYKASDKLNKDYTNNDVEAPSYWSGTGIKLWYKGKFAEIVSYKSEEKEDKPARYKSREVNGMDVIDLGEHWGLNFQETNILKYLLRDKGEDEQDMVKIADYAKRELELIKQRKNK